jgi:hypothetical protein
MYKVFYEQPAIDDLKGQIKELREALEGVLAYTIWDINDERYHTYDCKDGFTKRIMEAQIILQHKTP